MKVVTTFGNNATVFQRIKTNNTRFIGPRIRWLKCWFMCQVLLVIVFVSKGDHDFFWQTGRGCVDGKNKNLLLFCFTLVIIASSCHTMTRQSLATEQLAN
jgi:hypothetical protein